MNFWFKLFNFLLCVCVIVGYNFFVDINAKDNTIKELNTKVSSLEKQVEYDDNYIEDIKTKINKNKQLLICFFMVTPNHLAFATNIY